MIPLTLDYLDELLNVSESVRWRHLLALRGADEITDKQFDAYRAELSRRTHEHELERNAA